MFSPIAAHAVRRIGQPVNQQAPPAMSPAGAISHVRLPSQPNREGCERLRRVVAIGLRRRRTGGRRPIRSRTSAKTASSRRRYPASAGALEIRRDRIRRHVAVPALQVRQTPTRGDAPPITTVATINIAGPDGAEQPAFQRLHDSSRPSRSARPNVIYSAEISGSLPHAERDFLFLRNVVTVDARPAVNLSANLHSLHAPRRSGHFRSAALPRLR